MSKVTGLNDVLSGLSATKEELHNCIKRSVKESIDIAKTEVKNNTPVKNGYMREQIFSNVKEEGSKIVGYVYGMAEYNPYVEFGTGQKGRGKYPYKIKGFTLKYKADKWRVKIPDVGVRWIAGQEPQPHFGVAFENLEDNLLDILIKNTKKYR